jgi:hypothetical protein
MRTPSGPPSLIGSASSANTATSPFGHAERAEHAEPGWPARRRWLQLGLGIGLPLLTAAVLLRATTEGRTGRVLERRRSFLGALRVTKFDVGRVLMRATSAS